MEINSRYFLFALLAVTHIKNVLTADWIKCYSCAELHRTEMAIPDTVTEYCNTEDLSKSHIASGFSELNNCYSIKYKITDAKGNEEIQTKRDISLKGYCKDHKGSTELDGEKGTVVYCEECSKDLCNEPGSEPKGTAHSCQTSYLNIFILLTLLYIINHSGAITSK